MIGDEKNCRTQRFCTQFDVVLVVLVGYALTLLLVLLGRLLQLGLLLLVR